MKRALPRNGNPAKLLKKLGWRTQNGGRYGYKIQAKPS
jgi:hypothetical protein